MASDDGRSGRSTRRNWLKVTGAAATAGLAGCGGDDGDGDGDNGGTSTTSGGMTTTAASGQEITLLTIDTLPSDQELWNEIGNAFRNETGHTLNVIHVGAGDIIPRTSNMVRGGNAPELVKGGIIGHMGPLAFEGLLTNVHDVCEEIYGSSGIQELERISVVEDGNFMTAPIRQGIFWSGMRGDVIGETDADIFGDEWYITDTNWDQWSQAFQAMDEANDDMRGFGFSTSSGSRGSYDIRQMFFTNGVKFYGGDSEQPEFVLDQGENRDKAIEVLEWMQEDVLPYSSVQAYGWGDIQQAFVTGQVGAANYSMRLPEVAIAQEQQEVWENYKWFQFPHGPSADGAAPVRGAPNHFGLINESDNQEAAKDFLRFFLDSELHMKYLYRNPMLGLAPTSDILTSDRYRNYDLSNAPLSSQVASYVETIRPHMIDFFDYHLENELVYVAPLQDPGGGFNSVDPAIRGAGYFAHITQRLTQQDMSPGDAIDATAEEIRADFSDSLTV